HHARRGGLADRRRRLVRRHHDAPARCDEKHHDRLRVHGRGERNWGGYRRRAAPPRGDGGRGCPGGSRAPAPGRGTQPLRPRLLAAHAVTVFDNRADPEYIRSLWGACNNRAVSTKNSEERPPKNPGTAGYRREPD